MLHYRGYQRKLIDKNIEKALLVPRDEAIKRVFRKKDMDRVVFSVMYHPALPSIPRIIAKAYRTMVEDDPRFLRSRRWSLTGGPVTPRKTDQSKGSPAPGSQCEAQA